MYIKVIIESLFVLIVTELALFAEASELTRKELEAKYGYSYIDRFRVRNEYALTVFYSKNGRACEIQIGRWRPNIAPPADTTENEPISERVLSQIIERLTPSVKNSKQWGKLGTWGGLYSGGNKLGSLSLKGVMISYLSYYGKFYSATVTIRSEECKALRLEMRK